jgi:alpha-L-fucosidase
MKTVERALKNIEAVIAKGPFSATWESLEDYQVPRWYKDGKFGIFIHWGLYSVPAFGNEWYPRHMYLKDRPEYEHHAKTWGPHTEFGYKDFISLFKAERYDPAHWADLFSRAGAKFVVPVAEHHDGFAMYDSGFSKWCATQMGPKRDLIADLETEVRNRDMVFGFSSHREEHYWFFGGGRECDSDVQDDQWREFYGDAQPQESLPTKAFLDDWLARTCEAVDKFKPQLVWFDWWISQPFYEPYLKKFAAYYYNRGAQWGKGVAINYKNDAFPPDTAVFDVERGQLEEMRPMFWQTDTAVSKNSWGYIQNHDYKTAGDIVGDLVDIVSKNGALLLNVGPRPDGTIPDEEQEMLLDIGKWLAVNGEAIYDTRPWRIYGEGPTKVIGGGFNDTKRSSFTSEDIRFTRNGDFLYAIALGWPESGRLTIKTLAEKATHAPHDFRSISLLGHASPLQWTRDEEGLHVELPAEQPCDFACTLKLEPVFMP